MQHPVIIATPRSLLVSAKASNFPRFIDLKPIGPAAKVLAQLEAIPMCTTERVQA
jgi:hypothetical protein